MARTTTYLTYWWGVKTHTGLESSPGRTRTCDKAVNSRLLYQLSYRGLGGATPPKSRNLL